MSSKVLTDFAPSFILLRVHAQNLCSMRQDMCACVHYINTHTHTHTHARAHTHTHTHTHTDYCRKHLGEMTRTKREHEARTQSINTMSDHMFKPSSLITNNIIYFFVRKICHRLSSSFFTFSSTPHHSLSSLWGEWESNNYNVIILGNHN